MSHPLIDRLTGPLGWPLLGSLETVEAFAARPGDHALFIPGDPAKNLETADAAVILPELVAAFRDAFDVGVIADPIERAVRERFDVWPTPSLIFLSEGRRLGEIPKVRDWADYIERTRLILSRQIQPAA